MKSLRSIINKLSDDEIGTFRLFLTSHCRNGRSKKLELFDQLVNQSPEGGSADPVDVSRQSVYQLKKRLKEELYAFLLTQDQVRACDDRSFLEMECHKKLYCFKILFDKGIHDHAFQMLTGVLTIASKHALHSLYLEAVNLKNVYFPLAKTKGLGQVPVKMEIKKLEKSLGRNLYINHYLSESGSFLHENDTAFRLQVLNRLTGVDNVEREPLIDRLLEVNHLFCQNDFRSAYRKLREVLEADSDLSADANMLRLVHIEIAKACICMDALDDAQRWLPQPEVNLIRTDPFVNLLLELQFIIAVRSGDSITSKGILERARRMRDISENAVLSAKWSFYSLLMSFQEGDFRKVIKMANGDSIFLSKDKSCLVNVKMLELFSIYELKDVDWLYYKIESLRKILGAGEWKQQRISHIVNLLKVHVSGKGLSQADKRDKILWIEREYPWHPLSNEVINYGACMKAILTTDSHSHCNVSLADTSSYAKLPG